MGAPPSMSGPRPESPGEHEPLGVAQLTTKQLAWRRFKRHRLAVASAVALVLLTLACIILPFTTRYTYGGLDFGHEFEGPGSRHWLGTDVLGRDTFTRVFYAGRISLAVALAATVSAGILGTIIGALAGFFGGVADAALMRTADLFLAVPYLVVLLIVSTVFDAGLAGVVITLILFLWMPTARVVRGVFLSLREKEFVEAARAAGASNLRIMFSHMLPNAMGPVIVSVTLLIATAILAESALSFLGFGIQPPTPTWGNMVADARYSFFDVAWPMVMPGLAIAFTVLFVNLLGDGLRDALDPHQRLIQPAWWA